MRSYGGGAADFAHKRREMNVSAPLTLPSLRERGASQSITHRCEFPRVRGANDSASTSWAKAGRQYLHTAFQEIP